MEISTATPHVRHQDRSLKRQLTTILGALLILLWVYTAGSKLAAFEQTAKELHNQVFSAEVASILIWLLPAAELWAAALLLFQRTQRIGFVLSTLLMAAFTLYIIFVLAGYFSRMPCSCGGVLGQLGWDAHLWFNLFFLLTSVAGIALSPAPPNRRHTQLKTNIQR